MKLKTEWNDVEKTTNELLQLFNRWRISNLRITYGSGRTLEDIFGLPYTSSSDYAAIQKPELKEIIMMKQEEIYQSKFHN